MEIVHIDTSSHPNSAPAERKQQHSQEAPERRWSASEQLIRTFHATHGFVSNFILIQGA